MTNSFTDECIAKLLGPNPLAAKSVLVALQRRYRVIKETGKTDSPSAELAGAKVCWHKATGETKVIDLSSAGLTLPHLRNAGHRDHHQHPSRKKNNNTSNSERGKAAM